MLMDKVSKVMDEYFKTVTPEQLEKDLLEARIVKLKFTKIINGFSITYNARQNDYIFEIRPDLNNKNRYYVCV